MRCSNCGKEIPFAGNVCPWCKADKSGDQIVYTAMIFGAVLGGIIGFGGLHAIGVDSTALSFIVMATVTIVFVQIGRGAKAHQEAVKKQAAAVTAQKTESVTTGCPHCAEQIQPDAKICRFCQRDVA